MSGESVEVNYHRAELTQPDVKRQLVAAQTLLTHPEWAPPLVGEVLALLGAENESLREVCVGILEDLSAPESKDCGKLAGYLNGDELSAFWAATLLSRLGQDAFPATDALIWAVEKSGSIAVKERAALALGRIGPAAREALPALKQAAASASPRLARFAKEAIGRMS